MSGGVFLILISSFSFYCLYTCNLLMKFKTWCLLFFIIIPLSKAFCQITPSDDSFISKAIENTTLAYHHAIGINAGVYNGIFYPGYEFKFTEGRPYFFSDGLDTGWVIYDDVKYDSILLQYDEVIDELIAANSTGKMRLWTPRVNAFKIFDAVFVSLKKNGDSTQHQQFYQLLYKGKMMVLEKERKEIKENITGVELLRFIVSNTDYYIIKDGKWHSVNSKRDFFKLVSDHKDEVKSFIKGKNLSFKNDKSNTLAQAIAYYETLK